jgi:lipopolysaccharide/colanic/teichoic acid biosynthesis glycosyltransferase
MKHRTCLAAALKRFADFTLALIGLILLSPLLAIIAVIVRLKLGQPVIFRQERPGRHDRPFMMVKFRTMRDAVGPDGQPLLDRDRLTPFGEFLRKASLVELLELWNVLKGEISLVGPRPLLMRYTPYFTERERLRLTVPPGITGWAQVNGRNLATWDERLANDVWYVEHWSLWLDLRILVRTFLKLLARGEVVADARSIMLNLDEERRSRTGNQPEARDL